MKVNKNTSKRIEWHILKRLALCLIIVHVIIEKSIHYDYMVYNLLVGFDFSKYQNIIHI